MKNTIFKVVLLLHILFLSILSTQSMAADLPNARQVADCNFKPSDKWWQSSFSSLPANVANNPVTGDPEFCEFYQFSQEYFLFMISENDSGSVNFLDQALFPLLETSGSNSCDDQFPMNALNVRTQKSPTDSSPFIFPERVNQAGASAIYDQNGKVVFYEIRFTRNLCDFQSIVQHPNFPGKTVELKMAWKVLGHGDNANNFYHINASITDANGMTQEYPLGLVGLHMAIAADNHPEMVWVTIEQEDNTIACKNRGAGQTAHSFISQTCASGGACNDLNKTIPFKGVTIDPSKASDICEEFPWGTVEGKPIDSNDGLNIALLEKLNTQLKKTVTAEGVPSDLNLWANYKIKGALWVSDTTQSSGAPTSVNTNERGSLELANTVMETKFQGQYNDPGHSVNCFGCHNYVGSSHFTPGDKSNWNTVVSAKTKFNGLSHIFDDIILGFCADIASSITINSQPQAKTQCPATCASQGKTWNGQWTNQNAKTGAQLPHTLCGCCPGIN